MSSDEITTEVVEALPTPSVPFFALKPRYAPTIPTINPKTKVLRIPGTASANSTEKIILPIKYYQVIFCTSTTAM